MMLNENAKMLETSSLLDGRTPENDLSGILARVVRRSVDSLTKTAKSTGFDGRREKNLSAVVLEND